MDCLEVNKMVFNTEEEANERAIEINENVAPPYFCPLINGHCKKDCVCWAKVRSIANMKASDRQGFSLFGFYCGNAMFNGTK